MTMMDAPDVAFTEAAVGGGITTILTLATLALVGHRETRVNDDHGWQDMTILCDIIVTEMEVAIEDSNLIYALGKDRGLYFLRPDLFLDDTKPQPVPAYAFNAAGHMVLDQQNKMAYCTSQDKISEEGMYDEIVRVADRYITTYLCLRLYWFR